MGNEHIHDIVIVGGGPAGITAAVYAARKNLDTLVVTKNIGGQAALSGDIGNWTGYQFISGPDLAKKFEEHVKSFDTLEFEEDTLVDEIGKEGELFTVKTDKDTVHKSKTVILVTGRKPRLLGIPGEVDFKNKGVSYCATCDAPLFSGKDVAIVGGGNAALDAALQLTKIAKKIYLVTINEAMKGDGVMIKKVEVAENVEVITLGKTLEISGDKFVNQMKVDVNGEEKILDVNGIFIEIGSEPVEIPYNGPEGKIDKNDWSEIIVDGSCATNVPGLFAAGDVTNVPEKQIIVAAGQGCIASISAFKFISKSDYAGW